MTTRPLLTAATKRLLRAAQGLDIPRSVEATSSQLCDSCPQLAGTRTSPLPFFTLKKEHVGSIAQNATNPPTPNEFHARLCQMIKKATRRVLLASLYVGPASSSLDSPREKEFLDALELAASKGVDVTVLLDANRGLRKVAKKGTNQHVSSASAVSQTLRSGRRKRGDNANDNKQSGLFLFQTLSDFKTMLPSPLNEVAGVFHIKAYIVDDSLILSGANLSEEYFRDRHDRYLLFENGGGGVVDFYAELIEILSKHSQSMEDRSQKTSKEQFLESLARLFDAKRYNVDEKESDSDNIVAYAVPTFQAPPGFFEEAPPFPMDVDVTRNMLLTALELNPASSVYLSSAYLNPTPPLMSILSRFGRESNKDGAVHLMTAGGMSHGFAPKDRVSGSGRDWIPSVFRELNREAAQHITPNGGKILLYERPGWTFHAKGLWLTTHHDNQEPLGAEMRDPENLVAAIVGSGNYGARSELLDVESNCILVFPKHSPLKARIGQEWNEMLKHSIEWNVTDREQSTCTKAFPMRIALPYLRKLF